MKSMGFQPLRFTLTVAWLAAMLVLGGCAGTVKQVGPQAANNASRIEGIVQVAVQMSPDAVKQQVDNTQFNRDELASFVRRRLEGKGLLTNTATHRVDVVVTDIRVRSAFAAVMFGFMAGDDHIEGRVRLMDASGKLLRNFEVKSSYALGGIGGGQDGTRMNWLYDKFSELAVAELEKVVSLPAAGAAVPAPASIAPVAAAGPSATPSAAVPRPVATRFAAIEDPKAVPGLDDKGRTAYRDWLTRKNPRAFVVAEEGRYFYSWSRTPKDPTLPRDPLERALKNCRDAGRSLCTAYAVDDDVVYVPQTPVAIQQ